MLAYVTRRIVSTIPLLLIATFIIFWLVSVSNDPRNALALCQGCDQSAYERLEELYNLDQTIPARYVGWLGDVVSGDLGVAVSINNFPVTEIMGDRIVATARLAVPAFLLIAVTAVILGVYSAVKQYSLGDYLVTGFSFFGISMPTFFFGLLLQVIFAVWWQDWFGLKPFYATGIHIDGFWDTISSHTLPVVTLMLVIVAGESRFERAAMLEVINSDYIRTATAKGLPRRRIIFKHALRNALIPLVTIWALDFAALMGGSVITETVFSWPGLGRLLISSVFAQDLDLVMAITMFFGVLVIFFNLLADLLYGILDPRIRYD
jgi:peptide/nickel transport system permease protein